MIVSAICMSVLRHDVCSSVLYVVDCEHGATVSRNGQIAG